MESREVARVDNPYAVARQTKEAGAMAVVESQRAVAEVVAAMQVARQFPRDRAKAMDLILTDCTLPVLAEDAIYEYARGGNEISGPSIRLAEVLGQRWGNLQCGVKELSRGDGYSEVMAYAMDLETGFKDEKTFQVRHWRDRKNGQGYAITDERDIYELIANNGARRKRACILTVIPKDVQEAAVKQCEVTLSSKIEITPDTLKAVLESFTKFHVTQDMIEKRIQRRLDALTPGMYLQLRKIHNSLRDNMSVVSDWFDAPGQPGSDVVKSQQAGQASAGDRLADELEGAKRQKPAEAPKPQVDQHAHVDENGEVTNESIRKAIAAASSQEQLTPIMMDMMKLPESPERLETTKQWQARVMFLKTGKPAEQPKEPAKAADAVAGKVKPKGTEAIRKQLIQKMNKAGDKDKLDEAANEISLYEWSPEDAKTLTARYEQCVTDLL